MKWHGIVVSVCAAVCAGQTAQGQCGIQLTDYLATTGNALTVDARDGLVAVGLGSSGVDFVDASDPSSLTLLSTINPGINVRRVALVAGYAIGADGNSTLRVIDLSTPATPVQVGTLDIPGGVSTEFGDLDADGDIAVLSSPTGGVSVVDFSDPSAPVLASSINPTGYSPRAVSLDGGLLAVADTSTLRLYDLADPTSPNPLGTLPFGSGTFSELTIVGDTLVANGLLIDISDPVNPVHFASSGISSGPFAASSDRVIGFDSENLLVGVPSLDFGEWSRYAYRVTSFADTRDLTISGNTVFLAGGFAGLIAFDTSNPEGGIELRSTTTGGEANPTSMAATPSVLGAVDYNFDPGTISFYDISDHNSATSPYISAWWDNSYVSAAAKGDVIYAAYEAYDFDSQPDIEEPGVLVISAASPGAIGAVGDLGIGARQLFVDGDFLYARAGSSVWQYDVSSPENPALVVTGTVPGLNNGDDAIAAKDGLLFLTGASGVVSIIDMQAVGGPALLSQTAIGFEAASVSVNDRLIAVFSGDAIPSQVALVDYTDPVAPAVVPAGFGQQFPSTPLYSHGVFDGDVLYIADYFGPIHAYSMVDPADPALFNVGYAFGNYFGGMAFYNDTIFAGGFGVNIFDPPICIPVIPDCPGDVTGDGEANLADLNLVLANFGQTTDEGDATGDGVVDLADLNAVLAAFGTGCD